MKLGGDNIENMEIQDSRLWQSSLEKSALQVRGKVNDDIVGNPNKGHSPSSRGPHQSDQCRC